MHFYTTEQLSVWYACVYACVCALLPQHSLPDVLGVAQVALEGAISARAAANSLARGELPQGDLIPWTIGQQFQVGGVAGRRECGGRGRLRGLGVLWCCRTG
jgi:hypothetical protein